MTCHLQTSWVVKLICEEYLFQIITQILYNIQIMSYNGSP